LIDDGINGNGSFAESKQRNCLKNSTQNFVYMHAAPYKDAFEIYK